MIIVQDDQKYQDFVRAMQQWRGPLFIDTESFYGLDVHRSKLALVQIHFAEETWILDFTKLGLDQLRALKPLLEGRSEPVVMHNAVNDWKMIYHHSGIDMSPMFCTLIGEQLLRAGLRGSNSLAAVAERRFDIPLDKEVREEFFGDPVPITEEMFYYSARDAEVLKPIYEQQVKELTDQSGLRVASLEMRLIKVVALMTYYGMAIDKARLQEIWQDYHALEKAAEQKLQNYIIKTGLADTILFSRDGWQAVNTASPRQMLPLFQAAGLKVDSSDKNLLKKADTLWALRNKNGYNQAALEDVDSEEEEEDDKLRFYHHPLLNLHAMRSNTAKIRSTYIEGLLASINPITGRIHASFNQCFTTTGRFSCSRPNLQNLPKKDKIAALGLPKEKSIRNQFIAGPGKRFVIGDLAAIELVILASLSGDQQLIRKIGEGDVHSFVATGFFKTEINAANKEEMPYSILRDAAKTTTYAIMYGTGARNLYERLAIPLSRAGFTMKPEHAEEWLHTWKEVLFPDVGATLRKNGEDAVIKGFVSTVLGRRRRWDKAQFTDKWKIFAAQREGSNSVIQGSAADLMKLILLLTFEALDPTRAKILATVHDEMIIEVDEDYAKGCCAVVKQAATDAGRQLFPNLPDGYISISPKVSERYDK